MKRWVLFLIYGVFALAIQSVWRLPLDFLLLAIIFLGFFEEDSKRGFLLSLIFGFLMDVASLAPLGASLFSYGAVFGLIRFLKTKILFQTIFSRMCWVFLLTLFSGFLGVFVSHFSQTPRSFFVILPNGFLVSFLNATLSLFWFSFLKWYQAITLDKLMRSQKWI